MRALYCYAKWVNWGACAKTFGTFRRETISDSAFWTSGRVIPELLAVPLPQKTTAALIRLHDRRVNRRNLRHDTWTVHVLVPVTDHVLKNTAVGIGGTGANFEELVPVKVSDLVADGEVGQRLGTTGHDILQANGRQFGCAGWKVEDSFLKGLVFCNCHALSLVAGETDGHAQWKGLDAAAFALAAKQDHGDGDVGGWLTGDESFVRGDGGEGKLTMA